MTVLSIPVFLNFEAALKVMNAEMDQLTPIQIEIEEAVLTEEAVNQFNTQLDQVSLRIAALCASGLIKNDAQLRAMGKAAGWIVRGTRDALQEKAAQLLFDRITNYTAILQSAKTTHKNASVFPKLYANAFARFAAENARLKTDSSAKAKELSTKITSIIEHHASSSTSSSSSAAAASSIATDYVQNSLFAHKHVSASVSALPATGQMIEILLNNLFFTKSNLDKSIDIGNAFAQGKLAEIPTTLQRLHTEKTIEDEFFTIDENAEAQYFSFLVRISSQLRTIQKPGIAAVISRSGHSNDILGIAVVNLPKFLIFIVDMHGCPQLMDKKEAAYCLSFKSQLETAMYLAKRLPFLDGSNLGNKIHYIEFINTPSTPSRLTPQTSTARHEFNPTTPASVLSSSIDFNLVTYITSLTGVRDIATSDPVLASENLQKFATKMHLPVSGQEIAHGSAVYYHFLLIQNVQQHEGMKISDPKYVLLAFQNIKPYTSTSLQRNMAFNYTLIELCIFGMDLAVLSSNKDKFNQYHQMMDRILRSTFLSSDLLYATYASLDLEEMDKDASSWALGELAARGRAQLNTPDFKIKHLPAALKALVTSLKKVWDLK